MTVGPSLEELRLVARVSDMAIPLEILEYRAGLPNLDILCDIVDRAIDYTTMKMSQFPKEIDGQSEDQLTINLILQLNALGLHASHDTTSGGHCDFVVTEGDGFLWLAEAKKVSETNNSWISGGYDQLTRRYATGLPSQDRGSLIIFCNCPRIDSILVKWHDYFGHRYTKAVVSKYDHDNIFFLSEEPSERTGRSFHVRHKTVSAYFAPLHT